MPIQKPVGGVAVMPGGADLLSKFRKDKAEKSLKDEASAAASGGEAPAAAAAVPVVETVGVAFFFVCLFACLCLRTTSGVCRNSSGGCLLHVIYYNFISLLCLFVKKNARSCPARLLSHSLRKCW